MRTLLLIVLPACMLGGAGLAAERLICIADDSVGFKWNGKRWEASKFSVSEDRFVVEPEREGGVFRLKRLGEAASTTCEGKDDQVICGPARLQMSINLKSLRFMKFYTVGFLDGNDSDDNTPSITIGRCSPLN